ncbi:hypothetical protein [Martelella alba]|uniref:BMFP domain-containing protein YqiC n=1 Tax=Martelella alba TaxID=2590451 RepID=A0ABY2SRZ8_9HYPH|nr:hypothetical protein [Martelella alba]TKI08649.1 hypothetical protein FCN80_00935 [Martelella alba]
MSLEMAFNIVLAICGFLGGFVLHGQQREINDLHKAVEDIRTEYQRRDDARHDLAALKDLLNDLKKSIERIDIKLDRKADK